MNTDSNPKPITAASIKRIIQTACAKDSTLADRLRTRCGWDHKITWSKMGAIEYAQLWLAYEADLFSAYAAQSALNYLRVYQDHRRNSAPKESDQ